MPYNAGAAATARLVNTTLSGNSGGFAGGIISDAGAQLALINTTIGNSTSLYSGSSLQLTNAGPTVLENSILAVDSSHLNCYVSASTITTVGLNIVSDATCGSGSGFLNADPLLLPLGNNGGPTETQALDKLSPAIDAGSSCSTTEDQRHLVRPLGGSCDAGAFEFDNFSTFGLTVDASVTVNPRTGVAVVTGTLGCSEPTSVVLDVTLKEQVKVKRVPAVVQALAHVPISCAGPASVWSAALVPVSGAFEVGTGTASAVTSTRAPYFLAATTSTATRLYWGHK
ncbi:MAG: choice-of-anchor Q domain-containing protein [Gemmatimonadaceae bacterium]